MKEFFLQTGRLHEKSKLVQDLLARKEPKLDGKEKLPNHFQALKIRALETALHLATEIPGSVDERGLKDKLIIRFAAIEKKFGKKGIKDVASEINAEHDNLEEEMRLHGSAVKELPNRALVKRILEARMK